ncbi:MAG: flagellar motor protein MotB [Mariprofundaceae bacterium]|nr:flagellar motor protein MotB [Mariprofundaceae bacterium]
MNYQLGLTLLLALMLSACMSNKESKNELDGMKNESQYVNNLQSDNQDLNLQIRNIESAYQDLEHRLETEIANKQVTVDYIKDASVALTLSQAVLFRSGSDGLSQHGKVVLKKVSNVLKTLPRGENIRIVGHSDNVPIGGPLRHKYSDNWDLSAKRAAVVARYFIWSHRIPQDRFRIEGRAHTNPVATNKTSQGRQKNRRIEIFIEH